MGNACRQVCYQVCLLCGENYSLINTKYHVTRQCYDKSCNICIYKHPPNLFCNKGNYCNKCNDYHKTICNQCPTCQKWHSNDNIVKCSECNKCVMISELLNHMCTDKKAIEYYNLWNQNRGYNSFNDYISYKYT
jgi:hypothetical protein